MAFKRWTSGKPRIWESFPETYVILLGVIKNGRGPEKSNKGRFKVKPKGGLAKVLVDVPGGVNTQEKQNMNESNT